MRFSMVIPAPRMGQFQALVKCHDLRFEHNPIISGERAHVWVDGNHLPPGGCNAFFVDWQRLITPIVESRSTVFKRVLRRLRRLF